MANATNDLETLLQKGDVATATRLADQRIAKNANDTEALLVRARLHLNDREVEPATALILRAEDAGDKQAQIWKAILADYVGSGDAERVLTEVCAWSPRYEPYFVLGRLLNAQERFADAKPYLEKALSLFPNQPVAHFQMAYSLCELGDVKQGVDHLKRCLQMAAYPPAYVVLARLLEGNGDPREALKVIRQGLKNLPDEESLQSEFARLTEVNATPPA
jgi:tetratricopeptide (TPR) repeat protein